MIAVFLALIRTLAEFFHLQYVNKTALTIAQLQPFISGALVCAIALFSMTIFSFYDKHKWIIAMAVVTIITLLVIKAIYL